MINSGYPLFIRFMDLKFKYAFIDGNWVLHRNFCAMGGVSGVKLFEGAENQLTSSVTSSILKMLQEFDVEKIIILWDTAPYCKTLLLDTYKAGRYNPTDEDIDSIDDEDEKLKELNNKYNFKLRSAAKENLQTLGELGLPSIYLKGFEGDDLAYLMSKYCSEQGIRHLLVSIDSDWEYWCNPNGCVYNPKRDETYSYDDIAKRVVLQNGMSLFRFKSLYDTFYGSHNALSMTIKEELYPEDCHEMFKIFNEKGFTTELFDDPDTAKIQLETFDMSKYDGFDKISYICDSLDKIGQKSSLGKINDFGMTTGIWLNIDAFKHYYQTANWKLFQQISN